MFNHWLNPAQKKAKSYVCSILTVIGVSLPLFFWLFRRIFLLLMFDEEHTFLIKSRAIICEFSLKSCVFIAKYVLSNCQQFAYDNLYGNTNLFESQI